MHPTSSDTTIDMKDELTVIGASITTLAMRDCN